MAGPSSKAPGAFLTIGEVSAETGIAQHVLRYWESRFPELRPLQRAGNRRYYRPEDVALVRRIHHALNEDGYTIRGVQALLGGKTGPMPAHERAAAPPAPPIAELTAIRDALKAALARN